MIGKDIYRTDEILGDVFIDEVIEMNPFNLVKCIFTNMMIIGPKKTEELIKNSFTRDISNDIIDILNVMMDGYVNGVVEEGVEHE